MERYTRVVKVRPLIPPGVLIEELPGSPQIQNNVNLYRKQIRDILSKKDDRLVVIVGPCTVHDATAAIEYARLLKGEAVKHKNELLVVMRVYFEKQLNTVGWKGFINDPDLDGSFNVNQGLRLARSLLLEISDIGLPIACEIPDTISIPFISDLVSWGEICARTSQSQLHRELASGMSMPIGFKNGTSGDLQMAVDGMISAASPHAFMGVTDQGVAGIVHTRGNVDTHIILRGSKTGPNYSAEDVKRASVLCERSFCPSSIMIDCSHGNSRQDHKRQCLVLQDIVAQLKDPNNRYATDIIGVMIESHLVEGNQRLVQSGAQANKDSLVYGQSITDKCVGWDETPILLASLAQGVQYRRGLVTALLAKL